MHPIARHQNPRKQGDAGFGTAIAWFACNEYTVCVPLTDSQKYDLVVEGPNGLERVQVRTTTQLRSDGSYRLELRTRGGNRSGTGKTTFLDPQEVELLFIVTGDGTCYLIPTKDLRGRSTLKVSARLVQYRV